MWSPSLVADALPDFLEKAGRALDLYQGRWEGRLLTPASSSSARREALDPGPRPHPRDAVGRAALARPAVEHTYKRMGALTYLAALDIGRRGGRRPRIFGRSEPWGGIGSFDRLVWQVMTRESYASARRVFWIVDNGSAHRGQRSIDRLERRWPNLVLVHLPVHASWLNQAEIFFSIIQRKVLEPNTFENLGVLARTLNAFEHHWNEVAEPVEWNFTRDDLANLIARLAAHEPQLRLAA